MAIDEAFSEAATVPSTVRSTVVSTELTAPHKSCPGFGRVAEPCEVHRHRELVADLSLDKTILQESLRKKW